MEHLGPFLSGLGLLGVGAAILLAAMVLLVLPWLAIVECVRSNRQPNVKTFLVVGLVVTWGFGSLVYGLFITGSRVLRVFTVVAVLLLLGILVPSVISLGTGAKMAGDAQAAQEQATLERLVARFQPDALPASAVDPFAAIHFVHGRTVPRAATLAQFTLEGPESSGARDVDPQVRHVAHDSDNDRYFAVTAHDFGTITPSSGRFTRIEVDPSLGDFSYPRGVAFHTGEGKVIVMTSHVFTRFYKYDPRNSDWERVPAEIRDLPVEGLVYAQDADCLYALEQELMADLALQRIHRFSTEGASLGSIALDPPIPLSRDLRDFVQLTYSTGKLVAILPPFDAGHAGDLDANRIFAIDPITGRVSVGAAGGIVKLSR